MNRVNVKKLHYIRDIIATCCLGCILSVHKDCDERSVYKHITLNMPFDPSLCISQISSI
jgi:hypothetical protein